MELHTLKHKVVSLSSDKCWVDQLVIMGHGQAPPLMTGILINASINPLLLGWGVYLPWGIDMEVYGTHIWQTNHHWIFDLSCCGGLGKHQENKHSLSYVENVQQKTLTWHEPWNADWLVHHRIRLMMHDCLWLWYSYDILFLTKQEISSPIPIWLVVSTHLKNMLVKLDHFPKFRGEKKIFETTTPED